MRAAMAAAAMLLSAPFAAMAAGGDGDGSGSAVQVRRLALLSGVNDGGPERGRLRYAATDAQAFGKVLEELGGVAVADQLWVLDSDRAGLLAALERLAQRAAQAARPGRRVEVIFYYSGHSDEDGLLLRGQRLGYRELRAALERITSDVRIAVVDSCASGALALSKGGVRRPPFLSDASAQVRGHAILTSSSADEVSQESERLRGSFFTHHLVSGLRGAADLSRDGRVTLTEAYQFAFSETLARTEETRGGAQHPSYEIDLAGTGDLVITDLRASSAGLVLAAGLEGRVFVRDATGALVVEVNKRPGAKTELGLPPGRYSVRRELPNSSALADISLRDGQKLPLEDGSFRVVTTEATALRGDAPALRRVPVNLSLFPALSTNDVVPEAVENNFVLGVVTRSALLSGAALGVSTWVDQDARYFQLGLGNNAVGGSMRGAQVSLGANTVGGSVHGFQLGGLFNAVESDAFGWQLATVVNAAGGSMRGLQSSGLVGWAGTASVGAQITGAVNLARADLVGAQVTGGVNWAGSMTGAQAATINAAGELNGVQVGVLNYAGKARGVQIGVVNLAREMSGVPLALVNVIGDGQLHLEAFASDLQPVNVAIKSGTRMVYTSLFAGAGRARQFLYGGALGLHLEPTQRLWLDLDLAATTVLPIALPLDHSNVIAQVRLMAGWQLWTRFALFGGPTLNVFVPLASATVPVPDPISYFPPVLTQGAVRIWPGLQGGMRF